MLDWHETEFSFLLEILIVGIALKFPKVFLQSNSYCILYRKVDKDKISDKLKNSYGNISDV